MFNNNQENKVTIYEFSDQIKYDYVNGEIRSRGFEFGFMNSTLNPIPVEIEIAIRNDYFKVKCSKSNQEPALVARVLQGQTQNWSVIAVVSQIKDDGGRLLEVNRYFVSEGVDSLWKIIEYLEHFQTKKGQYPVFNPEHKLKQAVTYSLDNPEAPMFDIQEDTINYFKTNKGLIELNTNKYTLQQINYLAFSLANHQPYAWTYNVSYLEQPHSFNLIIVSDNPAHDSIYSALSTPQIASAPVSYGFDENAVKTAMKELISNSFSSRHLRTISDAISNTLIIPDNWHQIFNTERANRAVNEQLKGDRIGRLLTLRAMIISHTLGELIKWLEIEGNEKNWDNCLQFSKSFYNSQDLKAEARGIINQNLLTGVYNLLPLLLNQEIQPKNIAQLLTDRASVWIFAKSDLIKYIEKDLDLIGKNVAILDDKSLVFGEQIWQRLIQDRKENPTLPWRDIVMKRRQSAVGTIGYYKPFVDLFNHLEELRLYSYFSQISTGEVPISRKDFYYLFDRKSIATHYNLVLYRQISASEKLLKSINDLLTFREEIPVWFLFVGFILPSFLIGSVIGDKLVIKPLTTAVGKICLPIIRDCDVKNFNEKTADALNSLVTQQYEKDEIKKVICNENSSCIEKLKWEPSISDIQNKDKKEWVKAIKTYQDTKKITTENGYIDSDTKQKIVNDIKSKNSPQDRSPSRINLAQTQSPTNDDTKKIKSNVPSYVDDALRKFDTTKVSINSLINDSPIKSKYNNDSITILNALKSILNKDELENDVILTTNTNNEEEKKKWIIAIGEYQKTKMSNDSPDGIIIHNRSTYKKLKEQLLE